jgi:hypothetical protein
MLGAAVRGKVGKEAFKLLLRYMGGLQGAARTRAQAEAAEIEELDGGLTAVRAGDRRIA